MGRDQILKQELAAQALSMGFGAIGIALPGAASVEAAKHEEWLATGFGAELQFLVRNPRSRYEARSLLPECRSVVVLAHSYFTEEEIPDSPEYGRIARYAWGEDYHVVLRDKLSELGRWLDDQVADHRWQVTVDTAPLQEKALAVSAGLGWRGGNTLVLNERMGSYFCLGCLLTSIELPPDEPLGDGCGECCLCVSACPANALVAPRLLNADRCISYQNTMRKEGPALHAELANWLFGCDECQLVCPYNAAPAVTAEQRFTVRLGLLNLKPAQVLAMSDHEFQTRFGGTTIGHYGLERLRSTARLLQERLK